ncbi:MAG: P27 family phage terminase small subunit [Clostridia bacterium]|nr:P27 family phage terminase small subunit [Clostridia bacterium]
MNTNQNDTFLNAPQKGGGSLQAGKIAEETTQWLRAVGCEDKVERHLIEQYAVAVSRWRQAEEQLSTYGLLAKKNDAVCESPYIAIAERYQRQSNRLLERINRIVRLHGSKAQPIQISKRMKGGMPDGAYYKRTAYGTGVAAFAVCQ